MTKRATNVWLIVALAAWAAMVALFYVSVVHAQPASQPAGPQIPTNDPGSLLQMLISAWNTHNWPVLITGLCVVGLIFERHYKGLTGNKFSQWLGTKWGMFLSSVFTAAVTAASTVAFKGWKEIGNACVAAVIMAVFNFFAQLAGPATKAAATDAAPTDKVDKPATSPATPELPVAPPDAPEPKA